ncbi:hypothetical protein ACFWHR_03845 [Leucobacter sp. NPDC058333]|uniref:hypothetical protein n=1 Tax=Leucobacter sp. NPDC058333 TaxID=3346450 RepID=UPI003648B85D
MVSRIYTPDDKRLPAELRRMQKSLADTQRPTGTEIARTLLKQQEAIDSALQAIAEIQARSTYQVAPPALKLTYGTGFGQKGPETLDFEMPGPLSGRRAATLIGSGTFEWAGDASTSALGIYLRLELWQGSTLIAADVANVSNNPFIPAAFNGDSFAAAASVRIPAGANPKFQLRLYGYRSADGGTATDAGRVKNLSFTLNYSDQY